MRNSKMAWFKTIVFLVGFIIINSLIGFVISPKGGYSRSTLREMYAESENIDIAFAGSSYAIKGINPYIMDEELGCNTFDYSFSAQIYTGTYYSLKELFKHHQPKMIVLNTDLISYTREEEHIMAYIPVVSYFESLKGKFDFFINTAKDGSYIDRIFLWKTYHVKSVKDAITNIQNKLKPEYINYPQQEQLDSYKNSKSGYAGKGFVRADASDPKNVLDDNKLKKMSIKTTKLDSIQAQNIEYFKKIVDLCKENNSELVLVQMPIPTYRIFSEKNYFEFSEKIGEIAKEEGIDYYDYNLIKPEIFKSETKYFHDYAHFNSEGADIFSKSFAKFLKIRDSGEDMSKYFYNKDEYLDSINYINNTWFTHKVNGNEMTFKADSFYGGDVIPEYQFILTDNSTGESKIIRDYDTEPSVTIKKPKSNYKIRVNAREKGSDVEYSRYYEEEFKK